MSKSSSVTVPRVRCWVRVGWVCATWRGVAWLSRAHLSQVGTAAEPVPAHVSSCPLALSHQGRSAWAAAGSSPASGSNEPSSAVRTAALGCSVCEKDIKSAFNFIK